LEKAGRLEVKDKKSNVQKERSGFRGSNLTPQVPSVGPDVVVHQEGTQAFFLGP